MAYFLSRSNMLVGLDAPYMPHGLAWGEAGEGRNPAHSPWARSTSGSSARTRTGPTRTQTASVVAG